MIELKEQTETDTHIKFRVENNSLILGSVRTSTFEKLFDSKSDAEMEMRKNFMT